MCSVEILSNSWTLVNNGLSSTMTQALGDIDISQLVKAYNASIVTSGEIPLARSIKISTSAAVLSTTFLILIFPLSFALIMESIKEVVVVEKGISVIRSWFFSTISILALTFIFPPRAPLLYSLASIIPPKGKSGKILKGFSSKILMALLMSSLKLWGNIFVDSPTAIPSPP